MTKISKLEQKNADDLLKEAKERGHLDKILFIGKDNFPIEWIVNRPLLSFFRRLFLTKRIILYKTWIKESGCRIDFKENDIDINKPPRYFLILLLMIKYMDKLTKKLKDIKENMFGGEKSEGYNALMQALKDCAEDFDQDIYTYLDKTPKTSLVVELVDKLAEYGYTIKKEN